MSKSFSDPSLLTRDRLKRELKSNGVELPRGEQTKAFYVQLYKKHLSPNRSGEFSSDDDGYEESPKSKQIESWTSRGIKKGTSKDIVSADIKELTDDGLKQELVELGHSVGPITPSTRSVYERKLARLRSNADNNAKAVTTVSKAEFSDHDFGEESQEEEQSAQDDEFFYKNSRRGGRSFGATFTKNIQNTSVEKEVHHDMSVSRNVEHSSSVDRKTMNTVRQTKGDKSEEKRWTSGDKKEDFSKETSQTSLPPSIQQALTSTQRLSPEKRDLPQLRDRSWHRNINIEQKTTPQVEAKKESEVPKGRSKKWWIAVFLLLILIALTIAVVLNLERLPDVRSALGGTKSKKSLPSKSS